ncbi:MAG TPA: LacI family transcriptional regulator, partial [Prolixibacteraceae bacterium]|nr:LacI family transcriptional regulator [Prolixibacteraceae bacterium]
FQMGQKAAELIIREIETKERNPQTIVLPTELIIRESSSRKGSQ